MNTPQITFRELHYFITVASQKSFSKASDLLHISQPSLSVGIRSLENKLSVRLFDRNHKSIALTEKGHTLFRYAERILMEEQNLHRAISDNNGPVTGSIKITLPPIIASIYFKNIIMDFCTHYPEVKLTIEEYPSDKIISHLLGRSTNIAALVLPVNDRQIHTIPFAEDTLCLLMPQDHPLAQKAKCTFHDIHDERLILLSEDFKIDRFISEAFSHYGTSPNIAGRTCDITLLITMVQAKLGISIIPSSLRSICQEEGLCSKKISEPFVKFSIALAVRRHSSLNKAEKAWLNTSVHAYAGHIRSNIITL